MPRRTERTGPLAEEEILEAAAMAGFMADKRAAGFLLRLIGEVRRQRLDRRRGLEEAAALCEKNAEQYPADGYPWQKNKRSKCLYLAKAIRALISPSSEGGSGAGAPPFDQEQASAAASIVWTPKERACIDELMKLDGLTEQQVIRQALRHYQIICLKAHGKYVSLGSLLPDAKLVQSPTTKSDAQRAFEKAMAPRENPLHPMFRDHNCSMCKDGSRPCAKGNPSNCEYPHARND